jgi:hypothetical protein
MRKEINSFKAHSPDATKYFFMIRYKEEICIFYFLNIKLIIYKVCNINSPILLRTIVWEVVAPPLDVTRIALPSPCWKQFKKYLRKTFINKIETCKVSLSIK